MEMLCSEASCYTPNNERQNPKECVEMVNPGNTAYTDDEACCRDNDHTCPGRQTAITCSGPTGGSSDCIDGIPAYAGDECEDDSDSVAPVSKGVTPSNLSVSQNK